MQARRYFPVTRTKKPKLILRDSLVFLELDASFTYTCNLALNNCLFKKVRYMSTCEYLYTVFQKNVHLFIC